MLTTFAERFRKARTDAGLTQQTLADVLGCHQTYVTQLETGRRVPTLDRVVEIAGKLGLDPHALDPRLASTRRKTTPKT